MDLWALDLNLFRWIHVEGHRDWLDPFFWVLSTTGLGWVQALAILLVPLALGGNAKRILQHPGRTWLRATWHTWRDPIYAVGPMLTTLAVSGLLFSQGIKNTLERDRPSQLAVSAPQEGFQYSSFPSGHTTTSFALAFMLFFLTRQTRHAWVGWAGLAWAFLVGYSRIYRGVHWPSDVLGGVFAGLATASLVLMALQTMARRQASAAMSDRKNAPSN